MAKCVTHFRARLVQRLFAFPTALLLLTSGPSADAAGASYASLLEVVTAAANMIKAVEDAQPALCRFEWNLGLDLDHCARVERAKRQSFEIPRDNNGTGPDWGSRFEIYQDAASPRPVAVMVRRWHTEGGVWNYGCAIKIPEDLRQYLNLGNGTQEAGGVNNEEITMWYSRTGNATADNNRLKFQFKIVMVNNPIPPSTDARFPYQCTLVVTWARES